MCEPIRIQDAKWAARVEDLPLRKVQELAEELAAEKEQQK